MSAALPPLAALVLQSCLWAQASKAPPPSFSSDSIVNSGNQSAASLAPNVIATIFGSNLAFSTAAVSYQDVVISEAPNTLAGVKVTVGGLPAPLYYVSPAQINFVIPSGLLPGVADLIVFREGLASPKVSINLLDTAPALFLAPGRGSLAATHADGGVISDDAPARAGEIIVVYGTGLGLTEPRQIDGEIPRSAARIARMDRLRVLLDGEALPAESVYYAGITPGYPGLYQINLRLPEQMIKQDPELLVALNDQVSQNELRLRVILTEP